MNENNGGKIPQRVSLMAFWENASGNVTKWNFFGSRESVAIFDQLCQMFPDENCVLSSREILIEVRVHHLDQELLTL